MELFNKFIESRNFTVELMPDRKLSRPELFTDFELNNN